MGDLPISQGLIFFCWTLINFIFFRIIMFVLYNQNSLFSNQQRFSCHFFWLLHAHQLDQGRCDVCQAAALS